MSGMVVFLVGVSNILGWVMAFLQIPDAVAALLLGLTNNKYIILLIMNVILLVSGTFMDVTPALLIFTRHQGGPYQPGKDPALHAHVLCRHHRRLAAGHLHPGSVHGPASADGPGVMSA